MDLADYEAEYERCLAERGWRDKQTLDAASVYAQALSHAGLDAAASSIWASVAEAAREMHGSEHEFALTARGHLGRALSESGRHGEAIAVLEPLTADRARILGKNHPETLVAKGNLARALGFGGRTEEGLVLTHQIALTRQRILGPGHPDTLNSLGTVAQLLTELGRDEEALVFYEEVLDRRRDSLGDDHPDVRRSEFNLIVARGNVDPQRGVEDLRAVLLDLEANRADGLEDVSTQLLARSFLARFLKHAGDRVGAIEQYRQLVIDRTAVLGAEHRSTLNTRMSLASELAASGDHIEEAAALLEELAIDSAAALGEDAALTLEAEILLSMTLIELDRTAEALSRLERIESMVEVRFEPDHRARIDVVELFKGLRSEDDDDDSLSERDKELAWINAELAEPMKALTRDITPYLERDVFAKFATIDGETPSLTQVTRVFAGMVELWLSFVAGPRVDSGEQMILYADDMITYSIIEAMGDLISSEADSKVPLDPHHVVLGGALLEFLALSHRFSPGYDIDKRATGALSVLFLAVEDLEPEMLAFAVHDESVAATVRWVYDWAQKEASERL